VLPISEQWAASAREVVACLRESGIRAGIDERDTLSYRIRDAELHKVPYMVVVGEKEEAAGTVAVRRRGAKKKQQAMSRDDFLAQVLEEVASKRLD